MSWRMRSVVVILQDGWGEMLLEILAHGAKD